MEMCECSVQYIDLGFVICRSLWYNLRYVEPGTCLLSHFASITRVEIITVEGKREREREIPVVCQISEHVHYN
jgi:hypothetical protein